MTMSPLSVDFLLTPPSPAGEGLKAKNICLKSFNLTVLKPLILLIQKQIRLILKSRRGWSPLQEELQLLK